MSVPIAMLANINSSVHTSGRLGNHVIRNIAANFLAKRHNIRYEYSYVPEMTRLGLTLFNGTQTYRHSVGVDEANYFDVLNGPPCNIAMEKFYQTKEFMAFLRDRVEAGAQFAQNVAAACAAFRPNVVEDDAVFVHVRLGDIADVFDIPFSYYDDALRQVVCSRGYISSDSIEHPTCTALIKKYNLMPVNADPVQTILFASKCRHMVLSQGTFSWMLAFARWMYRRAATLLGGAVYCSDFSQEPPWTGNTVSTFSDVEIHYDPRQLVTGERLQYLALSWIGNPEDFAYNPSININTDRHLSMPTQHNTSVVFGYTHHLEWLSRACPTFERPFVLITHNSDADVHDTALVRAIIASPKLVRWYTTNLCFRHPLLRVLPIGIANRQWPHGRDFMHFVNLNRGVDFSGRKTNGVYLCARVETNPGPRAICVNAVVQKDVPCLPIVSPLENIERMVTYRFCICPPGNGRDTHRLWEALVLKCVPIVVKDAFIDALLNDHPTLPIIVLDQWTDFDVKMLPPYESFNFDAVDAVMNVRFYETAIHAEF